jgi:hypothetical protein
MISGGGNMKGTIYGNRLPRDMKVKKMLGTTGTGAYT